MSDCLCTVPRCGNPRPEHQFVPIPGYEGLYEVSAEGLVKSIPRERTRGGLLAVQVGPRGYRQVVLCKDGRRRTTYIYRLVARAFIGPKPEGMLIRHLDGDCENDSVENLAYGTPTENMFDTVRHGRHVQARKTHCPQGHRYPFESRSSRSRRCAECNRVRHQRRRRP